MDHLCICSHCQANGNGRNTSSSGTASGSWSQARNSSGYAATVKNGVVSEGLFRRPWYDRTVDRGVKFTGTLVSGVELRSFRKIRY